MTRHRNPGLTNDVYDAAVRRLLTTKFQSIHPFLAAVLLARKTAGLRYQGRQDRAQALGMALCALQRLCKRGEAEQDDVLGWRRDARDARDARSRTQFARVGEQALANRKKV